jgi:putative restriction endonuclease
VWEELISDIRLGRSGLKFAVHKPLFILLLLARAQQGESNRVPFAEIEEILTVAIRHFGPADQPGGAELPFWHLKNDGFWVLEQEGTIPLQKDKNRPTKGTLRDCNVTGHVPMSLWQELTQRERLINELALQLVTTTWTSPAQRLAVLQYFDLRCTLRDECEGAVA